MPATFVYSGINVEQGGLLAGTRGGQIAGRFGMISSLPFPYGTTSQRHEWKALVATLEDALRLRHHKKGHLLKLDTYLHERSAGKIGSLSHLVRGAAMQAILDGSETITRRTLDSVRLDEHVETSQRKCQRMRKSHATA